MAQYEIDIEKGVGTVKLFDGNYNAYCDINGYENGTLSPVAIEITSDKNEYSFTIAGSAMLMIYTYDGQDQKIEGATFYRCTKDGTKYGDPVISDSAGFAYLLNLPYKENGTVNVYFVQTASDGSHSFSSEIHEALLTVSTGNSVLIENPKIT